MKFTMRDLLWLCICIGLIVAHFAHRDSRRVALQSALEFERSQNALWAETRKANEQKLLELIREAANLKATPD